MNPTTQQPTYELLKDLPYLKAGTIYAKKSFWHFSGDNVTYYPDKIGMKHERFGIHADYIEDNPVWFRRVEVKDWEIVDCLEIDGKSIHPYNKYVCLGKEKDLKPCTIHSVRRLSDGETFTVGEDCGYLSISLRSEKPNTTAVIEKFEIKENDIWAYGKNGFFIASLNKLVKLPSPPVEQETIKVLSIKPGYLYGYVGSDKPTSVEYNIELSSGIPKAKYKLIKKAIELILNN